MADMTAEEVAGVVSGCMTRAGWRVNLGHLLETVNPDGTVTVAMWTHDDVAALTAAGYRMTGEIIRPSYVVTVAVRGDEQ